ncbi:MAG: SUMF1/EgtB/PvdO family nonheme iron enzyme [Saprospiraceae bacterium]|nr:SUMF1/EgtB/PvdO family nonheme iron enzyme [Saprospiraceae bacterium]
MVPVRGGSFRMGDEVGDLWWSNRPVHTVRLDNYWIGQFPVTQALWRAVYQNEIMISNYFATLTNPASPFFKGDRRPVEVTWDGTQIFLEKLNLLLPGWNFRLPTEAEWEYAARGGTGQTERRPIMTRYSGSDRLESVAWWDRNSHGETKPVGMKSPNALGLFDMSGNVSEWCMDWYDGDFYVKCAEEGITSNPRRNDHGAEFRVKRGGSWLGFSQEYCRVAYRSYDSPANSFRNVGFRLAASPSSLVVVG